jgi:hypothetical protein
VVFAWFVWPTPYMLDRRHQVNRFTGVRCEVGESCWREEVAAPETPKFDPSKCGGPYVPTDADAATLAYLKGYREAAEDAGVCAGDLAARSGSAKRTRPAP